MSDPATRDVGLVALLNDLLQLDHDAISAYDVAIEALEDPKRQATLRRYKGDHERHVQELGALIRERGGTPVQLPHIPTGFMKLAIQQAGALGGGDKAVLLAFRTNERQARDKYQRAAESAEDLVVCEVLARAADDEAKHYGWAVCELEALGVSSDSVAGRVGQVVEVANARMVDAAEGLERGAMAAVDGARRVVQRGEGGVVTALAAVGLGFLAARLFGRDR